MKYRDLRTGLTYEDVFLMFWCGPDNSTEWRYKKRHTVLGKWHQIKQEMWSLHLRECRGPVDWDEYEQGEVTCRDTETTVATRL